MTKILNNGATIQDVRKGEREHKGDTKREREKVGGKGESKGKSVGMLFHVIVITQQNSIVKFYNILQDHQTQTNKHIITKTSFRLLPLKTRYIKNSPSFAFWITNLLPMRSQYCRFNTTSLLCYSPSQGVISMWTLWSISRTLKQWYDLINLF